MSRLSPLELSGALAGPAPFDGLSLEEPLVAAGASARSTPNVSVIIACRNGAQTLATTIRSLRRQSLRSWEALIVDDGSTDQTAAIAARLAAGDRRIRLLRQPWGGVALARNRGIAAAHGDWLLFLDCDDWLARRALGVLLRAALRAPKAGVVVGRTAVVLPDGSRRPFPTLNLTDPFRALCADGRIPIHSALVRRELVVALGGFDPDLRQHEDWDLWQRLARAGVDFRQVRTTVACYRSRQESLSRDVRQATVNGLCVLRRGHAHDPRVPFAPEQNRDGAPNDALAAHELHFLLWSAARDIALGGDGLAIVDLARERRPVDLAPDDLAGLMASGMGDVLACAPHHLASRWPEFQPKLQRVLQAARLDACGVRTAALTLAGIEARLDGGRCGGSPTLDLDRPGLQIEPGRAPPEFVQLLGRRTAGPIAIPALGAMDRAAATETIVAQAARLPLGPTLEALAPWRAPPFWLGAGVSLCKGKASLPHVLLHGQVEPKFVFKAAAAAGLAAYLKARLVPPDAAASCEHTRRVEALKRDAKLDARALARRPFGKPRRPAQRRHSGRASTIPVLMYHRIAEDGPAELARYRVAPAVFEQQIEWLTRAGFKGITTQELATALLAGAPLPAKPVLITFDDGYADFATAAWPVLCKAGMPATLFVVPGKVGQTADWDGDKGEPASLLGWDDVARLAAEGVDVQSHGFRHRRLTHATVEEIYVEALNSGAAIRRVLGRRPLAFCYPFGARDACVERVVEACGYRLGFTTTTGLVSLDAAPLRLARLEISRLEDVERLGRMLAAHPTTAS
jgi:peptidoglycan/xylan/chitin deacetylase (PgdA/CDA1 family)